MGGDLEAAGDFATGALMARTIDPVSRSHAAHTHGVCLNCGTALVGAHCHVCGQSGHVHRSLGAIWHDLLHGVLHFEGRLWSTLPMLVGRPGELTRRYIDGERARFVSPMALFLFSVFTLFAVLSILGIAPPAEIGDPRGRMSSSLTEVRAELLTRRAEALNQRADPAAPEAHAAADKVIEATTREIRGIDRMRPMLVKEDDNALDFPKTGWKRLDYGVEKANKNPGLALYKLQANSYKFSWLLIPLSVPFVWLLFAWRREFHAYDHAVFVTYSIAFMSLLFIVLTLLGAVGVTMGWLVLAGTLIPPFHIYRQLRGAYRLSRRNALARTVVLLCLLQVVVWLFAALVLGLGLIG